MKNQKVKYINVIVDGNNMAHRAKHTYSLSNKGVDVSITYGCLRMLSSLMKMFKPKTMTVCWDGGTPDFRVKAVPEYKATRDKGDLLEYEDFVRQLKELHEVALPMMGIVSVRKLAAEADDLMYHASVMYKGKSAIVSSDRDMLQAINDNVHVYSPFKELMYDKKTFEAEYGIPLERYVDWRALIGDSSDNIPGAHGIGEKTATKLFVAFDYNMSKIMYTANFKQPYGCMTESVANKLKEFGIENFNRNTYIMNLKADRCGARHAVCIGIGNYMSYSKVRVKKYLIKNAFVSLMDSELLHHLVILEPPSVDNDNLRMPVVCERRFAA